MNNFKSFLFLPIVLVLSAFVLSDSSTRIDKESLLERHNYYRRQVGVPDLKWDDELAAYAQKWANHLARSCDMVHSSGDYGENIYWTSGSSTETQIVDYWADEKRFFNHKKPTFKSSMSGKYGHYTQMIWAETTHVGGARAVCRGGGEIWVCSYSPHGNIIGKPVF